MAKTPVSRTEADILAMLRRRHNERSGNGEANAFVQHVRSAAGFDARRTIDAVNMGLWPSRGLVLDGFEIKCSRSDWLRELKKPEKAEEFCRVLDRFWIVVSDRSFVHDGELPVGWGLLYAHGAVLRVGADAEFLHVADVDADVPRHRAARMRPLPESFSRTFLAALMREACRQGERLPDEIAQMVKEAEQRGAEGVRSIGASYKDLYDEMAADVKAFQQAAGITIRGYGWNAADPKKIGALVKAALEGDLEVDRLRDRLQRIVTDAESIAEHARTRPALAGEIAEEERVGAW